MSDIVSNKPIKRPPDGCRICELGTTRFFPADWGDVKTQLYIDADLSDGARLFRDVEANLRRHFYLKEDWQYRILALYVLQCKVAPGLSSVFYIGLGGAKGSGKTNLQAHVALLTKGRIYSNVSVPALAREGKHGDNFCIDEIDESKGKDYDSVRDALLRDGYKSNGPMFVRWDYKAKQKESFSLYGPKIFGYRGGMEDALKSRTFPIGTVKPYGKDGAKYVFANEWPEDDGLPDRLDEWGKAALAMYTPEVLKKIVESESFQSKLQRAVPEIGANRETQLSMVALLVAEMASIEMVDNLKSAITAQSSTGDPEPLEQLRTTVRSLLRLAREKGQVGVDGTIRLRQSEVRENVNGYRMQGKQRPLSDSAFAKWRRDLGIDDNMLIRPGNRTTWVIPKSLATELMAFDDEDENGLAKLASPGGG